MKNRFPMVSLKEVAQPVERLETVTIGKIYRQIGVRLWGGGAYERESIDGSQTRYQTLSYVEKDDIIVNKIWARNGSVAVVTQALAGCYGSGEFPTFAPDRAKLEPRWFHWLTKTKNFWKQCDEKSQGTSGKNRIRPEQFLRVTIPLPPLEEQRRIVARIEELAAKIEEARGLHKEILIQLQRALSTIYNEITEGAKYFPMAEAAPLKRRPVQADLSKDYHELGIRSFGKGTFHKPPVNGGSLGTKRIFRIEAGDLLFNNVFAWEGAVAVARKEDHGRVGSHRFLTCVPKEGLATSSFLRFHFLTERGLQQLGEASPGSAGRNRTLGIQALEAIQVPVPPIDKQIWFDAIQARVDALKQLQAATQAELDSLLPSILDKAFKGELV